MVPSGSGLRSTARRADAASGAPAGLCDAWNGAGHWTAKVVGQCEHLEFGEDIVVSGRRLSREAACGSQEPSLVERFFTHSALIPVLGRSHP